MRVLATSPQDVVTRVCAVYVSPRLMLLDRSLSPARAALIALIALIVLAPVTRGQGPTPAATDSVFRAAMLARVDSAAAATLPFSWFGRGIAAGAVAGPFGTAWVMRRAQESSVDPATSGADTTAAYREALVSRVQAERREYAFVGGVVGTAALLVVILKATGHLTDKSASGGPPGGGNPGFARIPAPVVPSHVWLSTSR